jgi:predicted unusual protein kinase regulating ubiquinone biosynthesis (AarF/ABC1/UbiB family)
MNVGQIEVGTIVFEVAQIAGDAGIRLPTELTMLGKTLLNLDQVGRTLDPEFDPNASIRANAVQITRRRVMKSVSGSHLQRPDRNKGLGRAAPPKSEQNPRQDC